MSGKQVMHRQHIRNTMSSQLEWINSELNKLEEHALTLKLNVVLSSLQLILKSDAKLIIETCVDNDSDQTNAELNSASNQTQFNSITI